MPIYNFQHRVETLLELDKPFEIDGFDFSAWDYDPATGKSNGWLAKSKVEASSADDAFKELFIKFQELVDRIAFVGQCYTSTDLEPFLISKIDDDRFFFRYSKKRKVAPLHFGDAELHSLEILKNFSSNGDAFRYLREATNANSFYTMLVMLASSLEALAGHLEVRPGKYQLNKEKLKQCILKDDKLVDRLFKYETGLRNQILHGGFVDQKRHGQTNYNRQIFDKIIDYLNENYGATISKCAVNRPRNLAGSFNTSQRWCRWLKTSEEFSLKTINDNFRATNVETYLEHLDKAPSDF